MKRNCNLCGKTSLTQRKYFIHGENRFLLCKACSKRIKRLKNQTQYEAARTYLENKIQEGQNEQIDYILSNRIRNTLPSSEKMKQEKDERTEENGVVLFIQSIGILGGGILFLFGICMLNNHLKMAIITVIIAVLLMVILYGVGLGISLLLQYLRQK